jgi:hypothetical protein
MTARAHKSHKTKVLSTASCSVAGQLPHLPETPDGRLLSHLISLADLARPDFTVGYTMTGSSQEELATVWLLQLPHLK